MNAIRDTLEELHQTPGIKGASVVSLDGLVVSEFHRGHFDSEAVAGLASFLLMTTNRSLREGGLGECSQFTLHATHGKVILTALEEAYLVVMFDQFADLKVVKQRAGEAAQRIRRSSRMS